MAAKKYYCVRAGRTPGIYFDWETCRAQVEGYSGAQYKGFSNLEDAETYLNTYTNPKFQSSVPETDINNPKQIIKTVIDENISYAFVDGSYNKDTKTYGYGGFLVIKDEGGYDCEYELKGAGCDPEMALMRNVAGEILGSMAAVTAAIKHELSSIIIYYDYEGIEKWANGTWKRNKKGTIDYYEFMQDAKKKLKISFVKVKAHAGIAGNETADRLAKEAVGLK